ncbi:Hypothetical protein D9617_21g097910 [Elsinoe fawcettii]|nr:Hypothetical protein D9617_21g097910 [Elsinoe fawcettii]
MPGKDLPDRLRERAEQMADDHWNGYERSRDAIALRLQYELNIDCPNGASRSIAARQTASGQGRSGRKRSRTEEEHSDAGTEIGNEKKKKKKKKIRTIKKLSRKLSKATEELVEDI